MPKYIPAKRNQHLQRVRSTSPGSDTTPTPPELRELAISESFLRMNNIIDFLRLYQQGRQETVNNYDGSFGRFRLHPTEFPILIQQLRRDPELFDFFEDKVRYYYFADANCLLFRMAGKKHQAEIRLILKLINDQFEKILKEEYDMKGLPRPKWGIEARPTEPINVSPTQLDPNPHYPEPDISFWSRKEDGTWSQFPALTIEVAVSQTLDSVRMMADMCLTRTKCAVRNVLGLVNPPNSEEVIVAQWNVVRGQRHGKRRKMIEQPINMQLRDHEGHTIPNQVIFRLPLALFVTQRRARAYPILCAREIVIDSDTILATVDQAVAEQMEDEASDGSIDTPGSSEFDDSYFPQRHTELIDGAPVDGPYSPPDSDL